MLAKTDNDQIVQTLLDQTLQAQIAWVQGNSQPYQQLFAHHEDITLAGPFGGEATRGWNALQKVMPKVAAFFTGGSSQITLLRAIVTDQLICLVMQEINQVTFAQHNGVYQWQLRVTQIYEKEDKQWRIIHRHVDPLFERRSLDEIIPLLSQQQVE
jgi:ketosteroid isomerase-like protein